MEPEECDNRAWLPAKVDVAAGDCGGGVDWPAASADGREPLNGTAVSLDGHGGVWEG